MPRDSANPRIFVSYARSDSEAFARNLREQLQAQGFSLWHDRQDMAGGRDWWLQITEAVERGVADVDERELAHRLGWTDTEYERW
jgi:hypothetical protein